MRFAHIFKGVHSSKSTAKYLNSHFDGNWMGSSVLNGDEWKWTCFKANRTNDLNKKYMASKWRAREREKKVIAMLKSQCNCGDLSSSIARYNALEQSDFPSKNHKSPKSRQPCSVFFSSSSSSFHRSVPFIQVIKINCATHTWLTFACNYHIGIHGSHAAVQQLFMNDWFLSSSHSNGFHERKLFSKWSQRN